MLTLSSFHVYTEDALAYPPKSEYIYLDILVTISKYSQVGYIY